MNQVDKNREEPFEELKYLQKKLDEYEEIKDLYENDRIELMKTNRSLRTLSECNQVLVRSKKENKFLKEVCDILVTTGGYRMSWIGYAQNGETKSVIPAAQSGFEEGYLENAKITWNDDERGMGPVGTSIRKREIQIIEDTLSAQNFRPWRNDALKRGYHSVISLPLFYNDKIYGALAIYSSEKNYFDENEIKLLDELSQDISYGITVLRNEIERKNFESELKLSERNYRKLVEISPNAISVHIDGKFAYINEAGLKIIGAQNAEELIGTPVLNIVHPDYRQMVIERIANMQDGSDMPVAEEKFIRLDGKIIDVLVAGSRMNYQGRDAIQVVVNDISKQKEIERELRENEKRFRSIFENSTIGMCRTSPSGEILMANPAMVKMLGYASFEEFAKTKFQSVYYDPGERDRLIEIVKSNGETVGFETVFNKKDGSTINVRLNISYIKNLQGEGSFLEGTIEDITTLKKIQAETIAAKERAEEINRIKSSLLANMSHELRTPLVAIMGFAEIFKTELEDEVHLEMADSIYISGQRLLETLNSILDLSRIEANKIDINKEELNISKIVTEAVNSFANFAQKKGLYITPDIRSEHAIGMLDVQMVHKIINNLINNAIKYTVKGGVTVEVDTVLIDNLNWIKIIIKDTGIGISENNLKVIFEEFRQASEGFNRNFEGTGLGLTIAKKFIEMLEGKINVTSTVGKGTEFVVLLPALNKDNSKNLKDQKNTGILSSAESGKSELTPILLVENDLPTIDVTRIILRKLFRIDVESNGINAISAAQRTLYNAVLMDINLGSGMDGTTAMKKIKELPGYSDIPIVAFTAYAMAGDREKFLKEGFTDYIAKPFEKKTLIELMTKIFDKG